MKQIEFNKLRFVICDDNQFMRRVLRSILMGYGVIEIYEAGDANEAYDLYMRNSPDVMIVDWEMPGLNGVELTKLIRKTQKGPNRYVPVIMLSGHTERKRVAEARDAGVTEFMCKPISAKALYKRVVSVLTEPRAFITSEGYTGPDRRRFIHPSFHNKERRVKTAHAIKIPGYLLVEKNGLEATEK